MSGDHYLQINEVIRDKSNEYQNSTDKLLMSANGYLTAAVILLLIGIFGFFFNITVIVIMVKDKSLRTPFNMILFNLVCSDFSVSVLGNPVTLTAALCRRWVFGRTVCVIYGFFMALAGIVSITTITVLSFERYLSIAKPFESRVLTISHSRRVICGIWLYSFAVTAPPLFGWGHYINESADISCSVNWEHKGFATTTYIIYLFVLGFIGPVCIIFFSYINIVHVLLQRKSNNRRESGIEMRVAAMIAVMVTVFLFAWTPYAVLALIVAFGDSSIVTPAVSVIPALLAKSSICYNPIIYAGLNTQIRTSALKIFGIEKSNDLQLAECHESKFETINSIPSDDL